MASLLLMVACTDGATEPHVQTGVVLSALISDGGSPIFRDLTVELDRAEAIRVDYWRAGSPPLRVTSDVDTTTHRVFLPRLRGASSYSFEVAAVGPDGESGEPLSGAFTTDSLPPDLAAIDFQVIGTPTFDLVMLEPLGDLPFDDPAADSLPFPIVVDRDGNIVWFRPQRGRRTQGFARLKDMELLFNTPLGLEVVTPKGDIVAELTELEATAHGQECLQHPPRCHRHSPRHCAVSYAWRRGHAA